MVPFVAGGRRRCIGLGGVGFAPSNEDLAFRAGVCHLMNLFLRTMFKHFVVFHGPVWMFWMDYDILATEAEADFMVCFEMISDFGFDHFGSIIFVGPVNLLALVTCFLPFAADEKFAGEKLLCQICRKKNACFEAASRRLCQ